MCNDSIIEKVTEVFNTVTEVVKNSDVFVKEVIKEKIPGIGIASTFRDEYLVRKLVRFLEDISALPSEKKRKIISKLQDENGELKNKFKERIVIALDRIDLEEKIDYYSKLVIMFCNEEINESLFYRCCKILENYSYYDICNFSQKESYNIVTEDDVIVFSMGLLQNKPQGKGTPITALGSTELVLSKAGEIFLKLNNI